MVSESISNQENQLRMDNDQKEIFNALGILVVELDNLGNIILINKKGCEILEYSECELVGKNWFDAVIPKSKRDDLRKSMFTIDSNNSQSEVQYYEHEIVTKLGLKKFLRFYNSFLKDGATSVRVFCAIDISNHINMEAQLKLSKDFINNIVNSLLGPVFVKDEKHKFVLVNDAFCEFVGRKREELMGKDDTLFFPENQVKIFWEKDDDVINNLKENVNEEKLTSADGSTKYILTKKKSYVDKEGNKFLVGIISDLTSMKEIEEERARRNEDLEKFNQFSIDRELKMIELKKEINELLKKSNQEVKYNVGE